MAKLAILTGLSVGAWAAVILTVLTAMTILEKVM